MRIITPEIMSYFAKVHSRLGLATHVPFKSVSIGGWSPKTADCHQNVQRWSEVSTARRRARGWLTWGNDEAGSCHLIAHSVVEDGSSLYDITPIDPNTPPAKFVIHVGPEEVFDAMQSEWSWTFYPFILKLNSEPIGFDDPFEL